jgi:putative dimethyl sulfoxide reductase chaperone
MSGCASCSAPSAAEGKWAASRGQSYGLLAWLFLETPDALFLKRMRSAEVRTYFASLAADRSFDPSILAGLEEIREWLAARAHQPLEQLCQELAIQGTRLLKGIAPGYGPPPPYEAVYRRPGAGVDAETLLSLREFYREAGADLAPICGERSDHLGMELDFMRFLCAEESRLWDLKDAGAAIRYRGIQQRFLAEHLLTWTPGYCQRILAEPEALFFHGVVRALSGFLLEDAALLDRWSAEATPGNPGPVIRWWGRGDL